MDYSMAFIITIFILGFIGSFISGMVGIGGSVINYPLLLFVPPLIGFASFTAHEASGITAVQVFFATLSGVWAYRKDGYLNKKLIIYMGIAVLIGSLLGGFGSDHMSEGNINVVYGILAILAVILMFIPRKGKEDRPNNEVEFSKWLASSLAFIVGVAAGIVGAGGAFLLVPIMLVVLKIPVRMTIASSLAITFISSIGSMSSKIITGQVLLIPAIVLVIASIIASPLGAKVGKKVNTKFLQIFLGILILATAIKIWLDILM
ncbi:sulfite exporter TauE/SafE family protein [Falsibacillus albus]|uniref:Probable membrane transporter protein n=1 Tax=Falsibacillus albus TaxID=2478915 RepID=A0A3L7K1N6_9BACI|nr:sulfite exporter TauE/SafE family protein [Falsibacillus albus]RLQ96710.1 sulfite exporter TauE/SafE family protein [Falsibacillus albus]